MPAWAEALLFYGLVFSEGEAESVLDPDYGALAELAFEERLVAAAGLTPFDWSEPLPMAAAAGLAEYFDVRQRILDGSGLRFGTFGSRTPSMYYLAIDESCRYAAREMAVPVDPVPAPDEWRTRLLEACRIAGLAAKAPRWYLVSALQEPPSG